jgi:hypothetical protein
LGREAGFPKPLPHAPEIEKLYKWYFLFILLFFKILERLKVGATTLIQLQLNNTPSSHHFRSYPGIFHHLHGPYLKLSDRQRPCVE